MFDRDQFLESQQRNTKKIPGVSRETEIIPLVKMLQAASVLSQDLMTESAAWNRYLEILQGALKQMQALKHSAEELQNGPDVWSTAELMKLKSDVRVLDAQIRLLQDIMQLPVTLVNGAKGSQEILDKFEAKYGPGTDTKETQS